MQPERLVEARPGISSPLSKLCTMPGFGDPSEQAAMTMALAGCPQRFGEHGQELGPCLRALITTERFEQRSDPAPCCRKGLGKGEGEGAGSSGKGLFPLVPEAETGPASALATGWRGGEERGHY